MAGSIKTLLGDETRPPTGGDDDPFGRTRLAGATAGRRGGGDTAIANGTVVNHTYRIDALLGRGGMGEAYRAEHLLQHTQHAIKVIRPELLNQPKMIDLFLREAEVLRKIRHEAIVDYDGLFRDEDGRLYLVMEYIEGQSLAERLRGGPLRPDELRILSERLCAGLGAVHQRRIWHRDLSPENVLLPGNDLRRAKLIDFGIAKLAEPGKETIVGEDFAGKLRFASPEQLGLFGGQVDARSDIYGLGLLLVTAALGGPLPMSNSMSGVIEARRSVPDLSRVPDDFRGALKRMLSPDPNARPQTMADAARLLGANGGNATMARSRTAEPTLTSAPRRGGLGWGFALGFLLFLGAVGSAGYFRWWLPQTAPIVVDPPPVAVLPIVPEAAYFAAIGPGPVGPIDRPPIERLRRPAAQNADIDLAAIAAGPLATLETEAQALYDNGDPDTAMALWEVGAERGSGISAIRMGELYDPVLWGTLVSPFSAPNPVKAREFYERAKALGATEAAARLRALATGNR